MQNNKDETKIFNISEVRQGRASDMLEYTYKALEDKGYNSINQLVNYLISGEPTYITSHNNARHKISQVEREDLLEVLLLNYFKGEGES